MTEYRSIHKGKTIDTTIQTVIDHDAIVKWGNIEGSLSNQTDLSIELNKKVPKTTTINGKALTGDITLDFSDVSALPDTTPLASTLELNNLTISLVDQNGNVMSERIIPTYNAEEIDGKVASRADLDLSNLSETGKAYFANPALSNLSYEGENKFANLDLSNLSETGEVRFRKQPALAILKGNMDTVGSLDLIDGVLHDTVNKEYAEPGTYQWAISTTGNYAISMAGGGGGGAKNYTDNTHGFWCSAASGGSGAAWSGSVYLTSGSIVTLVVGAGGANVSTVLYTYETRAQSGSDTILYINGEEVIRCGGGAGGYCASAVSGGRVTISKPSYISSTIMNYDGNPGLRGQGASPPAYPRTTTPYDNTKTGPGSGGGTDSAGYAGIITAHIDVAGSKEIGYKISGDNPLIITDRNADAYTVTGLNTDLITSEMKGTYNKFVSSEGSDLLNGMIFKCIERPQYYSVLGTTVTVNSDFIASGFSNTSYIETTKPLSAQASDTWNIDIRFRYKTSLSDVQGLFQEVSPRSASYVTIGTDEKIHAGISFAGSTYATETIGSTVLTDNSIYKVRLEFTGTAYNVYLIEDGDTFVGKTPEITISNSKKLRDLAWAIGCSNTGSIDLAAFQVVVDGLEYIRITPQENDVWIRGNAPIEVYRYNGGDWEEYNKVYIGSVIIKNGELIGKKESLLYNNNYDILGGQTKRYVVESYSSNNSWYMLYSDGWLVQGGTYVSYGPTGTANVIMKLLKNYRDTSYQAFRCSRWYTSTVVAAAYEGIWNRTPSTFELTIAMLYEPQGGQGWDWMTMGWAE